jgi:flagellin
LSLTKINQNISAINAQRQLDVNTARISKSIERLSSGLRINRGGDDPSGLVLSELLRYQVSGMDVAQQNSEQGVNVIKTAEGALNEVNALLRQMRDLAVSAASDSNNNDDSRAALQQQVASAVNSINQIASNTMYGSRKLLDGSAGTRTTIINHGAVTSASLSLGDEAAGYVDVDITQVAERATISSQFDAAGTAITGSGQALSAAVNAITPGEWGVGESVTLILNGVSVGSFDDTSTWDDVITAINTNTDLDVHAELDASNNNELTIHSLDYGSDAHLSVEWSTADTIDFTGMLSDSEDVKFAADNGQDMQASVRFTDSGDWIEFHAGSGLQLQNATYGSIYVAEAANSVQTLDDALYVERGQLSFQIGIQANQTAAMQIRDCRASALGTGASSTFTSLADVDISTVDGASAALAVIDEAISDISTLRGDLGAFQVNELEAQTRSLAVARENLAASESSIRDTDFGREMAEFTTGQILVQSATAFLAQGNSLPQNVLSLIRM